MMKNALSFDVEEYFQVENLGQAIPRGHWKYYESRLRAGMDKISKILDGNNTKATFFVLGWIAERHPELIKELHDKGHEIATHGYEHKLIYEMPPGPFKEDLKKSIDIIEGITGDKVIGHRAANFSVTDDSLWSLDIMKECGIKYDASIFPISHDRYGIPSAERFPHIVALQEDSEGIMEFPCSTVKLLWKNMPFSGGGYFRLLPYWLIKRCVKSLNKAGKPVMVYLHPWELDSQQPRIKTKLAYSFRHYVNLDATERKLRRLLKDFLFTTAREILGT